MQNQKVVLGKNKFIEIKIKPQYIGKALSTARRQINISKKDIALFLQVHRRDYTEYENGRQVIPKEILSRLFEVSIFLIKMNKRGIK